MAEILRIPLGFNNAYLIKDRQYILVDCGQAEDAPRLLKELRKNGIDRGDLGLLVITHAHPDHMGSAAALQEELGVPVAIHRAEEEFLVRGRSAPIIPYSWEGKLVNSVLYKKAAETGKPVKVGLTYEDQMDLAEFGLDGLLLATPGHTLGSSSVIVGEEAIIGDLLMMVPPFAGVPGVPWFAEDPIALWDSIKLLRQRGVRRVYPGHGFCWEMGLVEKLLRERLIPKKGRLNPVGLSVGKL